MNRFRPPPSPEDDGRPGRAPLESSKGLENAGRRRHAPWCSCLAATLIYRPPAKGFREDREKGPGGCGAPVPILVLLVAHQLGTTVIRATRSRPDRNGSRENRVAPVQDQRLEEEVLDRLQAGRKRESGLDLLARHPIDVLGVRRLDTSSSSRISVHNGVPWWSGVRWPTLDPLE